MKCTLAALAASAIIATVAHANPGSLDPTFGTGGKVTTDIAGSADYGSAVAVQTDGRIVVGGFTRNATPNYDFAALRYNADGTLDTGFGTGGKTTTAIGTSNDAAYGMAISGSDQKIVLAGYSSNGTSKDFALVRYTTAGALDTTFNGSGKVTTSFSSGDDSVYAVALQTDGKILAAGYANTQMAVARYTVAGALDTTFGSSGKAILPYSFSTEARAVAVQGDGKIVLVGETSGTNPDVAVARLTTSGTLDTTFNTTGMVATPIGSGTDYGSAVAVQGDGKIVVAGWAHGSNYDFAVVRYNADGALDTTFGTGGKVTTDFGIGDDAASSVAIQSDGKIVVAGQAYNGIDTDVAVVRYNTDGALDTTFGTGGKVTIAYASTFHYANGVALQPDGKIVVAGEYGIFPNSDITLARFSVALPDTRLGTTFAAPLGDNIYNLTATGQTLNTVIHHSGGVKTDFVCVQNDGPANDSFAVYGTPGNANFTVRYLYGAANVTYAVTHGTFNTGPLAPGASLTLAAKITVKTPLAGQRRTLGVISTSASDSTARDVALIKARSN
jgi:uncharacterized delta-60 repeat protein